ncbi:transcription-repair coupling factor [Helicobacter apodemus]|uniref:Transcription-repair-coupling factor n=1 Tax=Helicobacter apodemus TaxID=135569 RepID=A0A4U8UF69_9HELI|nr:transcription-repair coupling factor [Helicobacter apodemus]TLE16422.1 transcription-repair coupling factor [Helicobacter apodemus]
MSQSSIYEFLNTNKTHFQKTYKEGLIFVVEDNIQAYKLNDVAKFLGFESFVLPDFAVVFGEDLRSYQEELLGIFNTLKEFYQCKDKKLLFAPLHTILHKMPKLGSLQGFKMEFGMQVNLQAFKERLLYFGYEFVELVEVSREVSIRGDIIDIFLPHLENPVRISLFGDEIESIRSFDVQTQISFKEEMETLEIPPAFFNLDSLGYERLLESIEENLAKEEVQDRHNSLVASFGLWYLEDTQYLFQKYPCKLLPQALRLIPEIIEFKEQNPQVLEEISTFDVLEESTNYQDFDCKFNQLSTLLTLHKDKKIIIISKTQSQLRQAGIIPSEHKEYEFCLDKDYGIWILGKELLILSLNTPTRQKRKIQSKILIDELKKGDYVVHIDYGIALFNGIIQANIFGATRDFIELKYLGDDKLLLPVENLDRVDRYIADGGVPLLDKLGKGSFAKLKEKVREKLLVIAEGIVALAAKRELIDGIVIDINKEEILLFQSQSGFVYTQSQKRAIEEIFKELSSHRVMDRLLSGDVGFGKTEVAMNAMFACFLSGYQSAIIVPTTLLAYQHFQTLSQRLSDFGVKIARLDRYVSAKEKKEILKGLQSGEIHIVVGTHILLNVTFKNLALIVVDEEHKFGVKQKEKIKDLSTNIHLLTMSATPIPRTLNMALSHIKGLSELKEPPKEKLAVRSFVKVYGDSLIKESVLRELRRGGQIFYIYNNIASIKHKKEEILRILPTLKIAILHSQIPKQEGEDILLGFAKGEFDMLLCTSIVESGLHLPNANTILIDKSDRFGIADLHQLRGRVGRGNKEGFCYFLLEDSISITQEAKKRLLALEKNSYLGSGGALAYHDLEIRGGGNLLGEAQSGHIKNIGYSLYLRMLEEAIYTLSGNMREENNVDVKLSVRAFLSPELIASEALRLELYRRLSHCEDTKNVYTIAKEIEERFGQLDIYSKQFLDLIIIKILARNARISKIFNYAEKITLVFLDKQQETFYAETKDEEKVLQAVLKKLNILSK